ncbi:MAG: adenylate/guanylate cyclase domain-containing protein [Geminicoccaceae bacterium]
MPSAPRCGTGKLPGNRRARNRTGVVGRAVRAYPAAMRCQRCGAENAANRRFCGSCGVGLAAGCPACGFANEAGDRFCGGCGTALGPPVAASQPERRQVAVLFVDLVGFTAMTAELGPEDTQALLAAFLGAVDAIVERHGGTVDKHIGDCVMALFGAPTARGDDVLRSVRAALAVQAAMPEISASAGRALEVHGGIAVGEVVAGELGGSSHAYTVTGDAVNLAARLADRAETGELLVADSVRLVLGDLVLLEDVGEVALQGFARPQRAHRLTGIAEGPELGTGPLVGRAAELEQIKACLTRLGEVGEGRVLVLRADAGVGKSRLVRELERLAPQHGVAAHTAIVLDFGATEGRDALGALARAMLDEPAREEVADPYLLSAAGLPLSREGHQLVTATPLEERGRRQLDAFVALARERAARQPLLLVVEDVHWADPGSTAALAGVAAMLMPAAPAMLLLTTRHEGDPLGAAWLAQAGDPPVTLIELRPLRDSDARELAGLLLAGSADEAVARCVARAQGNPLFLEQLARHLRERLDDAVPVSVQTLMQARLDRLEPAHRDALRAASVLGQRFALAAQRAVLGEPAYDPAPLVQRLFLRAVPDGYQFAHALIRDAVYDLLLRSQRRELHRRAAEHFAGQDVVLHARHLDLAGDPRAASAYLPAARQRAQAYHTEEAAQLAARGLELAVTPAERFAAACLVGRLQLDLGRAAAAREAFATALELAADDASRCEARLGLADAMRLSDQLDDALAQLAAAELEAVGRPADLAGIHHLRGNILFPLGRVDECVAEHVAALDHARRSGLPELEVKAQGGIGDGEYVRGRLVSAHRAFLRCCELARELGLQRTEAANLAMVGFMDFLMLDLARAQRAAEAVLELTRRTGHLRPAIIAGHVADLCALARLDLIEAQAQSLAASAVTEQIGARRFEPENRLWLAECRMLGGERGQALEIGRAAMAISRETAIGFIGPAILGLIAWATTSPPEREAALAEAEELLARGSISHNHLLFRRYAIEASLDGADWGGAERHADALRTYTSAEPLPWAELIAARGRALAAHGRDLSTVGELARVRDDAARHGCTYLLPALDAALAQRAA